MDADKLVEDVAAAIRQANNQPYSSFADEARAALAAVVAAADMDAKLMRGAADCVIDACCNGFGEPGEEKAAALLRALAAVAEAQR